MSSGGKYNNCGHVRRHETVAYTYVVLSLYYIDPSSRALELGTSGVVNELKSIIVYEIG
jgi:hypothetical protein